MRIEHYVEGVPQGYGPWKERILELCCPALNVSELSGHGNVCCHAE